MTEQEHYEKLLKDILPYLSRGFNETGGYYYNRFAQFGWKVFQHRAGVRPTEKSKITKEQIAAMNEDDPTTIVDRLNGLYGIGDNAYPVSKKEAEAAREIVRLREVIRRLEGGDS